MDRRDPRRPPRSGLVWSDRFQMWINRDARSPGRRKRDEAIARHAERDRARIGAALRAAEARGKRPLETSAQRLARHVLRSLIEARKNARLSQSEVARRMGVPQPVVVRLESGTHSPTLATLTRYAAAIGVKLEIQQIA